MSENNGKPTKADLKQLIKDLAIDLKELDLREVQLINAAVETEDPAEHLKMIAEQQQERLRELQAAEKPPAPDETETPSDDQENPTAPEPKKVRDGDELVRQNEQHIPFCPYCSKPKKQKYVFCKAVGTKGPYTQYRCETKGCDFSTKRARPTVAKLYQKMNQAFKGPNVNARE